MFRITNISGQVIGIVVEERPGFYRQKNLFPNESLDIMRNMAQIYNLCDPVKKILKVEEVK